MIKKTFKLYVLCTCLATHQLFCVVTDILTVSISFYVTSFYWSFVKLVHSERENIYQTHYRYLVPKSCGHHSTSFPNMLQNFTCDVTDDVKGRV